MLGGITRWLRRDAVTRLWDGRAVHGESPIWVARSRRLLTLDTIDGRIIVIDPETHECREWPLTEPFHWIVEQQAANRFVVGCDRRIVELSFDLRSDPIIGRELFRLPETESDLRFNDAKASSSGHLFAGTMDTRGTRALGTLYRIARDGGVEAVDRPYTISNGPAIAPCGRVLYHADSAQRVVFAFDLDPHGALSNRRVHIEMGPRDGYPDGMTCDREGGLWIAHWGVGRVSRFRSDGTLDRAVPCPAKGTTSVAFFGRALDRLAITTSARDWPRRKGAGAVYAIEPGVAGVPAALFSADAPDDPTNPGPRDARPSLSHGARA